jgi:hypothetical protein
MIVILYRYRNRKGGVSMDAFQYLAITGVQRAGLAFSALPDAPTVPYVEGSRRVRRTRKALSGALHSLADHVAPTPVPARRTVCAD